MKSAKKILDAGRPVRHLPRGHAQRTTASSTAARPASPGSRWRPAPRSSRAPWSAPTWSRRPARSSARGRARSCASARRSTSRATTDMENDRYILRSHHRRDHVRDHAALRAGVRRHVRRQGQGALQGAGQGAQGARPRTTRHPGEEGVLTGAAPAVDRAGHGAVEDRLYRALALVRVVVTSTWSSSTSTGATTTTTRALGAAVVAWLVAWTGVRDLGLDESARVVRTLFFVRRPGVRRRRDPATPLLKGPDYNATIPGFWVMGALLAWAVHWHWKGGLAAAVALSVADHRDPRVRATSHRPGQLRQRLPADDRRPDRRLHVRVAAADGGRARRRPAGRGGRRGAHPAGAGGARRRAAGAGAGPAAGDRFGRRRDRRPRHGSPASRSGCCAR